MEPEAPGRRPRRRSARPAAQPRRDVAGLAEIARGSTLNLAGAAISAAATVGVTVLVTRQFTRPVAGAFFTATSLFLIVEAIAGLGAYSGVVYFIARLWSLGAESRIPIMLRAAIVPVVVSSVGAAVLLLAFADPLARALLDGRSFSGAAAPSAVADALRALAAALPFAALLDTFLGAGRGYRDMRPTVVVDRIGRSCLQLLGVLAAALTGTAALLAPLWALSYIPAAAAAWLWLRRIRLQHPERAAVRPGFATLPPVAVAETPSDEGSERTEQPGDSTLANANPRGFWLFTAPRAVATVAQMVIQRLDIVLVGIIRGPVEAAIYTAATRFLVVGQLGNAAISMAAQPQLSHLFARHDRRGANTVYQATTAWLIILTWPLYLLAVVYGPEVLTVFGHSYRAGATVMVILGLTMLLGTACGQVDMVLTTTGRSGWSLANGLLACSVNVVVDLALIPRYGITGAAIGWAAAITVANLVPLIQLAWIVRVHPFGTGTLAACVLCALSFGVIPVLVRAVLGGGAAGLAVTVAAGCAALAAGVWLCREPLQLSVILGLFSRGAKPAEAAPQHAEPAGGTGRR